ncbi:MAG: HNH endonuclease, partial [Candidatus Rokubacteria bacterium]|nr:HNH endonuclease [Candidatus Rokubacteria bacterium]
LWQAVLIRLRQHVSQRRQVDELEGPMYGESVPVRQRLGQGTFRVLVTDIYQRQCAVTREKALPVLEAAHIRPVSEGGAHRIDNGLLLRTDVHALFDRGYVTVTPDYAFRVSRRLKADFENGEYYYQFQGNKLWMPPKVEDRPQREFLEWHGDVVFRR